MNTLVGLGFDGCPLMTEKKNGVQKIICNKYFETKMSKHVSHSFAKF